MILSTSQIIDWSDKMGHHSPKIYLLNELSSSEKGYTIMY